MKWIGYKSLADITSITAGTGLDGGGTSGDIGLSVDVSDFMSNGEEDRIITASSLDTMAAQVYATLKNEESSTMLSMFSDEDTGDFFKIDTTTHGATTLSTTDDDATAGHITIKPDGHVYLEPVGGRVFLRDSSNPNDYAQFLPGTNGDLTIATVDDSAAAAHIELAADGDITLDANGQIKLEPATGNNILLDGTIQVDAGVVTGATSITSTAFVGTLSTASQPNITTVGTIGTGVWQGTAIATGYTKQLVHYKFMGYGTGDGTNYFTPMQMSDSQAPFEHADSSSSDGLTVPGASGTNVSEFIRFGGNVMPRAGTLTKWTGWASCNDNGNDFFISLFKWSPVDNNSTDIDASHGGLTLLDTFTGVGKNNDKVRAIAETSFTVSSVAAGDIIFTQIKTSTNSKSIYFNTTLEIEV